MLPRAPRPRSKPSTGGGVSSVYDPLDVSQYTFEEIKAAVIVQVQALRDGLRVFLTRKGMPEHEAGRFAAIMAAAMDGLMIHFMLDRSTDAEGALRAFEEMVVLAVRERG